MLAPVVVRSNDATSDIFADNTSPAPWGERQTAWDMLSGGAFPTHPHIPKINK